jgi:phage shock protein A
MKNGKELEQQKMHALEKTILRMTYQIGKLKKQIEYLQKKMKADKLASQSHRPNLSCSRVRFC